jgi:hypothetical protein
VRRYKHGRIDANCGRGVDETLQNAGIVKKLGVGEEQPLKADNWEGHKELLNGLFYQ